jgi:hemerythrin-like domain-containing protein
MQAIDELHHEHEAIGRVLTLLERQLECHQRNGGLNANVLRGSLEFLRGFADRCHHGKEEAALFPALATKNPVLESGPVKVLTSEHDAGRHLLRELEEAIPGVDAGQPAAEAKASRAIELYTRMLRKHIEKEEGIVFVLAQSLLTEAEAEDLARRFEAVEAEMGPDAHRRFGALIDRLEAESEAEAGGRTDQGSD